MLACIVAGCGKKAAGTSVLGLALLATSTAAAAPAAPASVMSQQSAAQTARTCDPKYCNDCAMHNQHKANSLVALPVPSHRNCSPDIGGSLPSASINHR